VGLVDAADDDGEEVAAEVAAASSLTLL